MHSFMGTVTCWAVLLYRTSVMEFGEQVGVETTGARDAPAAAMATGAREAPVLSTLLRAGQPRQDSILIWKMENIMKVIYWRYGVFVTQLVESHTSNAKVVGSIPYPESTHKNVTKSNTIKK